MNFRTYSHIDTPDWPAALSLYHQAFPASGRKPDAILTAMFKKGMSYLHTASASEEQELAAMAVTGVIPDASLLLIDYLTVRDSVRSEGIGGRFVRHIADWAQSEIHLSGMLLEAEAEPGPDNERRIHFWQRCGFVLTEYVHHYRWVPETYRAMYLSFDAQVPDAVQDGGRALFRHIEAFHKKAFER